MHKTDGLPEILIDDPSYHPAQKLLGKSVVITGGDSGIGAATAIMFAREGAKVAISYYDEDADAESVAAIIKEYGQPCVLHKGDLTDPSEAEKLIAYSVDQFGSIDVVINNAGTHTKQSQLTAISPEQLQRTFATNIFSMFYVTQAALPRLAPEACIINTASVTAYRGSDQLVDYAATKGAVISYTRSLSSQLAPQAIRVNAVAPGPVWTPLVIASFNEQKLAKFGQDQPLGRAAQPIEIAPSYVFLASRDARYMSGQVIHVNGGEIVNG